MARTMPTVGDLHPSLQAAVRSLAEAHRITHPETSLCLIWAHRTPGEQQQAYLAKRSKLDGVRRFSLHNYSPSLAADLWVYTGGDEHTQVLFEGRPSRDLGMCLELLQRGSLRTWYMPLGKLAEAYGLEAGALWRTFRDGPHVQMTRTDRVKGLQKALDSLGYAPGAIDGADGPRTKAALALAGGASGCKWEVTRRQARLMPCHPEIWAWLHRSQAEA